MDAREDVVSRRFGPRRSAGDAEHYGSIGWIRLATSRPGLRVDVRRRPRRLDGGGERYTGKIGGFDYDAGYGRADDRLNADGHVFGEVSGVKVDLTFDGHVSNFEFGGRLGIQNGKADNLNLLLEKLEGEVHVQASATRAAGTGHQGQQVLTIPKEDTFPIVIDGIRFVVTFRFAVMLNEGITNVGGTAAIGANLKLHGSHGAEWRLPGEPTTEPTPKAEGEMSLDFDVARSEGAGIGPQALLVAVQYPRIGFGLGWGSAHPGTFIDVVTAASTVVSGAAAIIPCKRGEVVITGSSDSRRSFCSSRSRCACRSIIRRSRK